jgi:D-sedoheptulose 7-phosphate isomerase
LFKGKHVLKNIKCFDDYLEILRRTLNEQKSETWDKCAEIIFKTIQNNKEIFIIGNGGSATIANHFHVDWSKGYYEATGNNANVRSLCLNTGLLTAIANDRSFEDVFVDQLRFAGGKKYLLVAISCSGNSPNVVKAVDYALNNGNEVIALTGFDGGKLIKTTKNFIHVNINDMQISEDIISTFGHFVLRFMKDATEEYGQ